MTAAPATHVATKSTPAHHPSAAQFLHETWFSTVNWVQTHWLQIIIAAIAAVAIIMGLQALRRVARRFDKSESTHLPWLRIFGRALGKTTNSFIVMVALRIVVNYADTPPVLNRLVAFLFTIFAVLQAAIWAREVILGAIENRTASEHYQGEAILNAMGLIRLLVSFAVFAIAAVVLLDNLGVNVTGLVAGLGVGGIAIGLAAQGIFADLFAALAIIFDRPFSKGEVISFGGNMGTVEDIGLKSTRVRAFTGEQIIVANKNLLNMEIQNVTGRDHIRLPFTIGVAYETPPETLARIPDMLKEMVEAEGAKPSRAGFESFGGSSLDYKLLVDVPGSDWSVAHPLRDRLVVAIMKRFAAEGIVIAYPTQTNYFNAPDGQPIMPWPQRPQQSEPDRPTADRPTAD